MSWYVRRLLLDNEVIRKSIVDMCSGGHQQGYRGDTTNKLDPDSGELYWEYSFDDDTYSDLLTVEKKIGELVKNGTLSQEDLDIINETIDAPFSDLVDLETGTRKTVSKKFRQICELIAFHLGDYFTDDGYMSYIINKYHLSFSQIEKLRKILRQ